MRKSFISGKKFILLVTVLALLCGCGRGENGEASGLGSVTATEGSGATGQENSAASAAEGNAGEMCESVYENGKQVLTFGMLSDFNGLGDLIAAYNQQSEEYVIQVVDYYDEEKGYDASQTALQLDIVRGQAPDLLDLSGIDYYAWAEKGILEDLYLYIDQDEELGRDSFVGKVLEAFSVEGKLYAIGTHFNLFTLCGKTSKVGERTGYNVAEMLEMLERFGEDQSAIDGFSVEEPALTVLCTFSMNDFIDWDKGTCDFTGEEFKQILGFCKNYHQKDLSGSRRQAIQEDEILLSMMIFNTIGEYQLAAEEFGEPVTCVGFPVTEGSGTLVNMLGSYAISASSSNKDACWDFLKYMLKNEDTDSLPILQQQFDDAMQQAMIQETEENGNRIPTAARISLDPAKSLYVYAASQEQVDAFRALVDSADRPYQYHMEIMSIITEEAEAYFDGRRSLEEAVDVIQRRVGIYVAE